MYVAHNFHPTVLAFFSAEKVSWWCILNSILPSRHWLYLILQEVFQDPNRDESFIIELLELKDNVADAGSARWFLQDLAVEQAAENSLVCLHCSTQYPWTRIFFFPILRSYKRNTHCRSIGRLCSSFRRSRYACETYNMTKLVSELVNVKKYILNHKVSGNIMEISILLNRLCYRDDCL